MRCPDCSKFVSFDTETEPEVDSENIDDDGSVSCSVRIVNNCADCGTELTEAVFEMEGNLDSDEWLAEHQGEGHQLEVEVESAERSDRAVTKDRNGKPIKSARYMKTMYGAEVILAVKCSCGAECEDKIVLQDEIQSSYMDELV
jgi:hypothetical protein